MKLGADKIFHLHWHNNFEIVRATEGRFCVQLNQSAVWLEEGDCILLSPGCVHDIGLNMEPASAIIIQFGISENLLTDYNASDSLKFLLYTGYTYLPGRLISTGSPHSAQTVFLCDEIYRTLTEEETISEEIVKGAVLMLLVYFTSEERSRINHWKTQEKFDIIKLSSYIEKCSIGDITLEGAAEYMKYSRQYFSAKFKRITGINFKEYVDQMKMQEARRMLGEGKSATEIAEHLGYSCVQNFSRAFRRFHHTSLKDMNKSLRITR